MIRHLRIRIGPAPGFEESARCAGIASSFVALFFRAASHHAHSVPFKMDGDPLGVEPLELCEASDISSSEAWNDSGRNPPLLPPSPSSPNVQPRIPFDQAINDKIRIWRHCSSRSFASLAGRGADAIVVRRFAAAGVPPRCSASGVLNALSSLWRSDGCIFAGAAVLELAGNSLEADCLRSEGCRTGDSIAPCRYSINSHPVLVIHTFCPYLLANAAPSAVTPARMYHTASETSLHGCYYSCMLRALEGSARTVAIPCINQERKGFPRELAVHLSLRTIRRFFEAHASAALVILAIESMADVLVYDALLPLYFPRSDDEACAGSARLPSDLGDPITGAPHFPDREVRVTALPGAGGPARAEAVKEVLDENGTAVNLNRSAFKSDFDAPFTAMRSDLPVSSRADDPTVASALVESKYVKLLMQSKTADLTNLEKMGFFSDTGVVDRVGRKVFLFLAGRFAVSSIPPSQLLLLIIRLLDDASARAFSVVYCHTSCGLSNLPSPQVVKNIYDSLTRQYKKNFKALYVVHSTWTFKAALALSTTLVSPKFSKKIVYCSKLEELTDQLGLQLDVPNFVLEYDRTL